MRLQCQFGKTMVLIVLVQGTELSPWAVAKSMTSTKVFIMNILQTTFPRRFSCLKARWKPSHEFPGEVQVEYNRNNLQPELPKSSHEIDFCGAESAAAR